jgi:hypothetical protein
MYKRSPILRAALSPRNQEASSPKYLSDRLQTEISKIRLLANLSTPCSATPFNSDPVSCPTPAVAIEEDIRYDIEKCQEAVLELINLFQEYRMSVDTKLSEIEARIDRNQTRRISDFLSQRTETTDVNRLRDDLDRLNKEQGRLAAKVKRMNDLNCEAHMQAFSAIKSAKDLINR